MTGIDPSRYPRARPPRPPRRSDLAGLGCAATGWVGALLVLGLLVAFVVAGVLASKGRIEFLLAEKQPGVFTTESAAMGDEDYVCTGTFAVHGETLPGRFTYDGCTDRVGATYEVVHRAGHTEVERGGAAGTFVAVVTIAFFGGSALCLVAFFVWSAAIKPRRLRRSASRTPPAPPRT